MYIDAFITNITHIFLKNLLHSISTFKNGFEKFTFTCKTLIFINNNLADLSQISLDIHKYKSDLEVALLPHIKITCYSPLIFLYQVFMLVPNL